MKVYIAGKITGEPIEECFFKFHQAEMFVSDSRFTEAINPLKLPGIYFGINYNRAMSICLKALRECDAIYLLRDWEQSPGAMTELIRAKEWGLEIIWQTKLNK